MITVENKRVSDGMTHRSIFHSQGFLDEVNEWGKHNEGSCLSGRVVTIDLVEFYRDGAWCCYWLAALLEAPIDLLGVCLRVGNHAWLGGDILAYWARILDIRSALVVASEKDFEAVLTAATFNASSQAASSGDKKGGMYD